MFTPSSTLTAARATPKPDPTAFAGAEDAGLSPGAPGGGAVNRIYMGDSFAVLRTLQAESFDAVVTDPPYHLKANKSEASNCASPDPKQRRKKGSAGFMGMKWDGGDIAFRAEFWREVLRVMKPGAHLVAFSGTRTYHRMVCGIEDAGFEIRDQLGWAFGSGFPKSSNQSGEWEGYGTALKPAWEPIVLARKPLIGSVPENLAVHRTGALHIDAARIPFAGAADETQAKEKNQHAAFDSRERTNTIFGKDTKPREDYDATGRWPANLVHDGSDEVADALGSNARFFYCAKASREDRDAGCEMFSKKPLNWSSGEKNPGSFQSEGTVRAARNSHPTVKPTDLMRWLCRLVTPPGGRILDPFFGSGSTGRGAVLEGFTFTGIEREAEYGPIARARVIEAAGEMFAQVEVIETRTEGVA